VTRPTPTHKEEEPAMTIKDLLVHVDRTPAAQLRLGAGLALARRFGAHVTALHLVAEPFLRGGSMHHLPAEVVRGHLRHAEEEADAVLAAAKALADRRGVALDTRRESGTLDRLPAVLARIARNADLVVVGEPGPEEGGADDALLVETAFMDTGRPALVVPHAGPCAMPPDRVLVAWDGSREAARAVHDALPLLRVAADVVLLVVDADRLGPRFGRQPGAGLLAHLGRHDVAARVKAVGSGGSAIAKVILDQAGQEGAGLVVMGGYGHSRLREMMLGGATRHMLERMTLPVLFAH
jgi:nucleotide-binding universal stress UspA family protein